MLFTAHFSHGAELYTLESSISRLFCKNRNIVTVVRWEETKINLHS